MVLVLRYFYFCFAGGAGGLRAAAGLKARNNWLLLMSLVFYAWGDGGVHFFTAGFDAGELLSGTVGGPARGRGAAEGGGGGGGDVQRGAAGVLQIRGLRGQHAECGGAPGGDQSFSPAAHSRCRLASRFFSRSTRFPMWVDIYRRKWPARRTSGTRRFIFSFSRS